MIESYNRELTKDSKVKKSNYNVPEYFSMANLLFVSSGGDVIQQKYIEDNFTTIDLYERVLMKNIERYMNM